jgi:hypothetical protein
MDSEAGNEGIEVSSINAKNKLEQSNSTFILRRREVKELKKKILVIAFALMFAALLVSPLVGAVQAKRTKEPYYVEYGVMPVSPPTVEKEVGVVEIARGSVLAGPYNGPLGVGTMTAELVISKTNTKAEKGVTIFKNTLEITSGPYGAFTLEGLTHFKGDEDGISGKTVLQGMSELGPVTIIADKGFKSPPKPLWEEGWIIVP